MQEKHLVFGIDNILASNNKAIESYKRSHILVECNKSLSENYCDNQYWPSLTSNYGFQTQIVYPIIKRSLFDNEYYMYDNQNLLSYISPKKKKPRTSFSKVQVSQLEKKFYQQKYLSSDERAIIAKELQMSDAQVKTWFQNRRTKWRRQVENINSDSSEIGKSETRNE
ncbi:hypothetical protein GJ496_002132 [Pomphorhynchus laevis]|nr:hypothetical protein GJ496_002132 [Pomphorhynchus laevis]